MNNSDGSATDRAPVLLSVNVGMPKDVPWHDRSHGYLEGACCRSRMVRRLDIDGDGQGDLQGRGGEQRAVLVYLLLSDSERLAAAAAEAGVDVTLEVGQGLPHVYQLLLGMRLV